MLSFTLLVFAIGSVVAYISYNLFFHPLARVPGPLLARITPLWLAWQSRQNRRPTLDLRLHRKYGSVVRVTPDEIMFANPAYFKAIYGAGSARSYGRTPFLTVHSQIKGQYDRLNMLLECDIDKLRVQKRVFGPAYSTENARKHEKLVDNNYRRWALRLRSLEGEILDFYSELELMVVDVYCEVTFGQAYGAVERGSDGGHMASTTKRWGWIGWVGNIPWFAALQHEMMKRNVPFSQFNLPFPVNTWALGKMKQYAAIASAAEHARNQDGSEPPAKPASEFKSTTAHTMRDTSSSTPLETETSGNEEVYVPCLYQDLQNTTKSKTGIGKSWAQDMAMTNIGAGIDTTAWTLATVVAKVFANPSVYRQLRNELDDAVKSGTIEKHTPIPYDVAANLPYLQACMKEAQRLLPNVAVSLARTVPSEGITIDDYFVPPGYIVGMNSRQLGLSEEIFGADPESFVPERWLAASKERLGDMESRNLAFGGPSRKCPGMHVAWVAMSKILAGLFTNFEVQVLNRVGGAAGPGGRRWVEIGSFPTMWEGMEVRIRSR